MRPSSWNRPLLLAALAMVPCIAVCLVGLAVDDRQLVGAPIWLKPLKFSLSILLFTGMWAWLVGQLPQTRAVRRAAAWIAGVLVLELAIIIGQVVRGRQSHFNYSTPLDLTLFLVMGISIGVLTVMNIALTLVLLRQRTGDAALTSALRAGALTSLAGLAVGVLMVLPRPRQVEAIGSASFDGILGAHGVGAPDGGPTMAMTGWSTTSGDLRVPHFLGLHALQALPMVALALVLLAGAVPALANVEVRQRLVRLATAGYAGVFLVSLWQALRGQPVTHPDALTWTALSTVAAVVLVGIPAAIAPARARVSA